MTKTIANAFALQPDSLEGGDPRSHPEEPDYCESCDAWAKKYSELEAVLSACEEFERIATRNVWEIEHFHV